MMNRQGGEPPIRRILVALDASHHSLAALEAAAELAAALKADLEGLFVEDVNLLRLAALPAAREVQYPCCPAERLDPARMERQLRAQATQAQRALTWACKSREVTYSFRVVRGEVSPQVLEAALGADLLSLGRCSRPFTRSVRLGSTARAAAAEAPSSVLLMQRGMRVKPPVVLTYDDSPTGRRALAMATHLARKTGGYLTVIVTGDTRETVMQLRTRLSQALRKQRVFSRFRGLVGASAGTLAHAVRAEKGGVLVLSDAVLPAEDVHELLDQVACPVLLMR
jgi:nucleotide-binding universal stress UspA family protein